MLLLRIARRLLKIINNYFIRKKFKCVDCNINKISIGPEVSENFTILHPRLLSIGDGTVINGNLHINSAGGVKIGRFCHIAKGLTIYSSNHNYKSQSSIPYDCKNIFKPVSIGDAVWIGANVTIAPGAKIGNGAIISMGSVVFGTVDEGVIVQGNPAITVGIRDMEVFCRLYREERFF